MAIKEKKVSKKAPVQAAAPVDHAGKDLPVPEPRLRNYYMKTVRGNLAKQFSLANVHQIPTLGQRPVRKKAKKSIANYGLREGQEIGAAVTLRGARMWEFLDRFITTAIPRIRDFKGLSTRAFDGRGNYSLGIKEQMIFPEINYDQVEQIHGMDITFVTTTNKDDQAFALLRELGMPFRGDDKPIVVQQN
jgi:large subunit ribosomal protein L5